MLIKAALNSSGTMKVLNNMDRSTIFLLSIVLAFFAGIIVGGFLMIGVKEHEAVDHHAGKYMVVDGGGTNFRWNDQLPKQPQQPAEENSQ
jgi:hypothetical protein